jgi:dissimilatory sulfite reductase flavoprotein subunit
MGLLKKKKKLKKKSGGSIGGNKATSAERPKYVPKTPPCTNACPNNNDMRGVLVALGQREKFGLSLEAAYQKAWETITLTNPFPSVCGRVCPHPCETDCNRSELEGVVNINAVERSIGDKAIEMNWALPHTTDEKRDEKIAVIGAGPAGLTCAYHLARRGYQVTVFEAFSHAGGMLYYGIPAYRLPRELLQKEIDRITDLGVELKLNCAAGRDIPYEDIKAEYKAIFVGIGAHKGRLLGVEGEDAPNVMTGAEFLNMVNSGHPVEVGDKVLVVGGGDTAIDAARISKRLGAKEVTVVYRRTIAEMPAIEEEIEEAKIEGIKIEFLAAPIAFHKEGDRATGMQCIRMELGEPDDSGRRRPVPIEGSEFDIDASMVVSAISQAPDFEGLDNLHEGKNWVQIDEFGRMPLVEGAYGGGDATDLSIATTAMAQGRHAADTIHAELTGEQPKHPVEMPIIKTDKMKLAFYEEKARNDGSQISMDERFQTLEAEVNQGLTEEQMLDEAARCMSCGACFLCENCWMFCQVSAVKEPAKKGDNYEFKLEYCDGCKKCAEECPCGYIEMFL